MNPSDIVQPLIGGGLIGLSASLLLVADGRIAGISGIAAHLLGRPDGGTSWRAAFLIGLVAGPVLYMMVAGQGPVVRIEASWPVLAVAGLLVGFGTRLGSGCTSGHGVCGLARLSGRSMVAVLVFMVTAMVAVYAVRHGVSS